MENNQPHNEMDPHGQDCDCRDMFLKDCQSTLNMWETWLKELTEYIETAPNMNDALGIMADYRNAVHDNVNKFIVLTDNPAGPTSSPDLG